VVSRLAAESLFEPITIDGETYPDYCGMAVWYCEQVVAGNVLSPREEKLACQRFLTMYAHAQTKKGHYFWSDEHVIDICSFTEKLPHVKAFTGTIVLEPVQCWWLAAIFGFRERRTGLRWVRAASIWIPRKNTKTTLAVAIMLFCANCENEPGAEITISAGSEKQAHIPYDALLETLKKDEDLTKIWDAEFTKKKSIFHKTGAVITLAMAKAQNLDGFNPHMVLAEELHAQSQAVIGVLRTAMGSRQNPLFLSISTAGRDTSSPAYDEWRAGVSVLEGKLRADRDFIVIYGATEEEAKRRFDDKVIEKINPMYDTALRLTAIEGEVAEAKKGESKLQEYLRTRLNVWTRAAGNLISMDSWNACEDLRLDLDTLKGFPMFVGIDLASRSDLNAAAFIVKAGKTLYTVGRYWLPREANRMFDDRYADSFHGWHREGWLELTDGSWIDQRVVLRQICAVLDGHNVLGIGLDDYQADHMSKELEDLGFPVFIIRKNAKSLTPATEDLIGRVKDPELFQHDGNPITAWCASNVVGYWDANDNVLPKKEKRGSPAAIDGMDALIMADALMLDYEAGCLGKNSKEKERPNPYLSRGLAGYDAA
jgi:phage terminase large subunit-like protein